jgi:hypothetical protein
MSGVLPQEHALCATASPACQRPESREPAYMKKVDAISGTIATIHTAKMTKPMSKLTRTMRERADGRKPPGLQC